MDDNSSTTRAVIMWQRLTSFSQALRLFMESYPRELKIANKLFQIFKTSVIVMCL